MVLPAKPVVLVVLDGWGIAPPGPGNAIHLAQTPNFDRLIKDYPNTQLKAFGEFVGLPQGEDGNSEVGHLNIGAGQVVYQNVVRINRSIAEGTFRSNQAFLSAINHVRKYRSSLHLLGLVGNHFVHSSYAHLLALLDLCRDNQVPRVFIQMITDGRDSPPHASASLAQELEGKLKNLKVGRIASVMGRYYAMDRNLHWGRTKKAYDCLTKGSKRRFKSAYEAIDASYRAGITDEFIEPSTIIDHRSKPVALVKDNDAIIFFNYREDRARQLTKSFVLPEFEKAKIFRPDVPDNLKGEGDTFKRVKRAKNLFFTTMIEYEKNLAVSAIAFPSQVISLPLAKVIAKNEKKQFHIAETEKYAHVTYFFNGGREDPFKDEDRVMIPSPKVPTYDLKPEMSAWEVTDSTLQRIETGIYDFIVINYANADMVGHTGNLKATIKAVETIDSCLGKLIDGILKCNGLAIITADHGNAEELKRKDGGIDTKHSTNPVPFVLVEKTVKGLNKQVIEPGVLADIAPTILHLIGIAKPEEMTGRNLVNL